MSKPEVIDKLSIGRIFLLHSNPRHEPFKTEGEAIAYLCAKEDVYALARDIVKHGINLLSRYGVFPADKKKKGGSFFVAEGNRRICALKLLSDPQLAPANLRKSFTKLSEEWSPIIKTVPAVKYENYDSARIWLDRIHSGPQGGVGPMPWNADQKARFDGKNKNKASQALLDYAEKEKMISLEDRKRKLTTVHRFLSNDVFREALGFDQSNANDVARTRPKDEFDIVLKRFMRDLVDKKDVHSRMNKKEITTYARPLNSLPNVTIARVDSESLTSETSASKDRKPRRKKPKTPEKARHVQYDEDIFQALKTYGNGKLESLYHSITAVELDPHTPMVSIGVWAFFETLTVCAGRNNDTSFPAYLTKSKLQTYGIMGQTKALKDVIARISNHGNTTKHHSVSASFNGDQLNNDMIVLKQVVLKCIDEAAQKAT